MFASSRIYRPKAMTQTNTAGWVAVGSREDHGSPRGPILDICESLEDGLFRCPIAVSVVSMRDPGKSSLSLPRIFITGP